MTLGALAFLNPWLLAALASLPIIYWLLRTVPPRPRQVEFPPTRILIGLENREKTPAKTPWWLLLIRLAAAALVILALAEPVLNADRETTFSGTGPVVIVVDNGWTAAPRWSERQRMAEQLIARAEAQNRPVLVVGTANADKAQTLRLEAPADARTTAAALQPQPYAPDRPAAATAIETALAGKTGVSIVWLTDGVDHKREARAFADRLAGLAGGATFAVIADQDGNGPVGVFASVGQGGRLEARMVRPEGASREGMAHAFSARGQRLAEAPFAFAPGATETSVAFDLPLELRNQVARVEIAGERSAGAVSLLDARSQWQRVGLMSGESREQAQPLLASLYYINKALAPYAEVVASKDSNLASGIDGLLKQNVSVLMLADIGTLAGEVKEHVENWVDKGGVLVRFAGARLEKGGDDLLPVALRLGGRTLGGALSWSTPQPLAPFDSSSVFAGLEVPPEVTVSRQILADPARLGPDVAVWARLKDGTPLVTAARRGQGRIVLFHVTANSDWSNLPLSGLFVEMLRRITSLGRSGVGGGEGAATDAARAGAEPQADVLPPVQVLDGFGVLKSPPPTAQPLAAAKLDTLVPSLDHPPGYYGAAGSPRALNLVHAHSVLLPLPALPASAERRGYERRAATPLKPWLLAAATALIFADIVAVLLMQMGGLRWRRRPVASASSGAQAAAVLLLLALALAAVGTAGPAAAQTASPAASPPPAPSDDIAQRATRKVTLGYVITGDRSADDVSRIGLSGLGRVLALRTSVEPGEPIGVNIVSDEIAFYPVLYWPVLPTAQPLPVHTLAKIDAYMKQGGMIVFDTRDYGQGQPTGLAPARGGTPLQKLLGQLDIPRLEPVPEEHVLTKSFYLLRQFPGRWDGGQMWVEANSDTGNESERKARRADGVTSIIVTSNDFAAAWALDERGRPLYPTVPGGEVQREMAFRTGINIVMHALTGNYKADQVHVPALLERLGQ